MNEQLTYTAEDLEAQDRRIAAATAGLDDILADILDDEEPVATPWQIRQSERVVRELLEQIEEEAQTCIGK